MSNLPPRPWNVPVWDFQPARHVGGQPLRSGQGLALRAARKRLTRSLEDIEEVLGIDEGTWWELESGAARLSMRQYATLSAILHNPKWWRPTREQAVITDRLQRNAQKFARGRLGEGSQLQESPMVEPLEGADGLGGVGGLRGLKGLGQGD